MSLVEPSVLHASNAICAAAFWALSESVRLEVVLLSVFRS